MRIAVVGAGAMGCWFGARLAAAGEDVALLDRSPEEIRILSADGIRVEGGGATETVPVAAASDPAALEPADLVLVFVKAHQTRDAVEAVAALRRPGGRVLTLQNGLGGGEVLAEGVPPDHLLVGTTAQGATQLGPGHVRHGGSGPTVFGPYAPGNDAGRDIAAVFTGAGLPAEAVDDPRPGLWRKLAINCGINALTALAGIRNGRIPEIPAAAELCRAAVAEAAAVAAAEGVSLGDPEALGASVLKVAEATAANRSSMGQDVDARRPTEIQFINGAVVRRGAARDIETPVNRTLLQLVQTLEATFGGLPEG
jgi:2-dehydropantoate 2-reductase